MNEKGIKMVVSVDVQGAEGLNLTLTYTNTDMKTVLIVEKALIDTLAGLVNAQIEGKI